MSFTIIVQYYLNLLTLHVLTENNISVGEISNLPIRITIVKNNVEYGDKQANVPDGPKTSKPGPTPLNAVSTLENAVCISKKESNIETHCCYLCKI